MKCKILMIGAIAFVVMSAAALPGDISGEWTAEIVGRDKRITKTFYEFKVDGSKLTGSVLGYPEDERPIFDGKVKGDKISFALREYFGDRYMKYMYVGKISGNTIKFRVVRLGAQSKSWKFTAKKVSP